MISYHSGTSVLRSSLSLFSFTLHIKVLTVTPQCCLLSVKQTNFGESSLFSVSTITYFS